MSITIKFAFFLLLILLFLNGCNSNNTNKDLFNFKGSYIGDNSAIGNIVNQLPSSEYLKRFEIKTNEEPYGMILNYEGLEAEEQKYKETTIYNVTFIFALVQNAEWITFKFAGQEYHLTREVLLDWYAKDLSVFSDEAELRKLTQENLEDESKVNQFNLFNPIFQHL